MKIDRTGVSGSLTGHRVLSQNLQYYYENKEARCEYQRKYYESKRDFIRAKRSAAYAKDEDARKRKCEYEQARYRKNRVKIALKRKEMAEIKKALAKAEKETAVINEWLNPTNRVV